MKFGLTFNMEDSFPGKVDQENGSIDSLPEYSNAVSTENPGDGMSSIDEDGATEKVTRILGHKKDLLDTVSDPIDCEEKTSIWQTTSRELNGACENEQSTTESKSSNLMVPRKDEDLPRSNNSEDDIDSTSTQGVDTASLAETSSELPDSQPQINDSLVAECGEVRSTDRKSEASGKGETLESEGENLSKDKLVKDADTIKNDNEEAQDTWMDILGNGLLKKRLLREGKGQDSRPDRGQVVTLQVAGRTEDGTAVDWNRSLEFILGDGEVIQAFDLAVALMELDEVCELVTDPKYAYGKAGKPDGNPPIPPDAKLTYELHLLATRDGPNITNMTDEERLILGEKKREIGNNLYTKGDYSGAISSYQKAIKYLSSSVSEEVQSLQMKCWNNMAAAQLKIKAYSAAEKSCSQVLQVDPENVLAGKGETENALVYIKKADQLDPGNKSERSMYRRMVGDFAGANSNTNNRSMFGWPLVFGATVIALGGILMAVYLNRH
ncbi:Peptidyl-prolyl cis-trans isomerase FKBP8 [Acropora cervicornis]|uniref:peptidylprolyl isomerase n=1 Tax=Acropora cervicornis TaxID=6130 RepID=A0AAD9PWG4_ACRCE|nr:Peptidyl-prolyl cis-trans isomerase FKBP8 [Acropora cervicornis]